MAKGTYLVFYDQSRYVEAFIFFEKAADIGSLEAIDKLEMLRGYMARLHTGDHEHTQQDLEQIIREVLKLNRLRV